MNQGQQQFYQFILERTREGKDDEAKALLEIEFQKQAKGEFTKEDAEDFAAKIMALLKPEKVDEVKMVMNQFSQNLNR